jgi:RNA polymerase sigma factor (sigma-70 family)
MTGFKEDVPSWSDLLACLQIDLEARTVSLDASSDECWREVRSRIRQYAERILAERHPFHAEEVDDVVQAVLLKLQIPRTLARLQAAQTPLGYLVVMIRNAANDLMRRRWVEHESSAFLDLAISGLEEIHGPLEKRQDLGWLAREIQLLKPAERGLLYMRFWKGLRISQIAETMGLPYSRVAVRLFRLLRKLEGRSPGAAPARKGGLRSQPPPS